MSLSTLPEVTQAALANAGAATIEAARALGIQNIAKLPGIGPTELGAIALVLAGEAAPAASDSPTEAQIDAGEADAPDAGEDDTAPITEAETTPPGREFTTRLQDRHANWVENVAKLNNDTPSHIIEQCVRRAYAEDRTKGGTAGGSTVLAEDFDGGEA